MGVTPICANLLTSSIVILPSFPDNDLHEGRGTQTRQEKMMANPASLSMPLCTPGHGRELMGWKSPVREPMVFMIMDTNKSTSRRQGRLREEGSEGSPMANVRDDEQKPHTRLSLRASWHNIMKPTGSGGRVNAAFVHGKLTFLSGEICMSRDRSVMRESRNRFTRLTKNPAYPVAVNGVVLSLASKERRDHQF